MNRTRDVVRARGPGTPWATVAAATLAGALFVAGCGLPAAPAHPRVWTLFDFDRLAKTGAAALAPGGGIPGGVPVSHFVESETAGFSLTLSDAWTEGLPAAYVTTELWSGFAQVWVQPQYVPVTGWNADGSPQLATSGPDAQVHPIFGVGPGTAFYTPFWQQIFFDLPAGSRAEDFTSSRQVIDSGATLHPAGAVVCPLAPPGFKAGPADPMVGMTQTGTGWVDGQPIDYLRIGTGTFRWDANRVVQELPLFTFTMRDVKGNIRTVDGVPTVGGTGAIGSGAPADVAVASGQPKYGALWRAYTVTVPAGARVFAPPLQPEFQTLRDALDGAKIPTTDMYGADVMSAAADVVARWVGRIAINPSCFGSLAQLDPASGAGSCVWLDSQRAIEREIDGEWIRRTDLMLTCPFVSYAGRPVAL